VIAPGNLMFYHGTQTFPQWNGNGFISGLATKTLNRIIFDGHGGAKTALSSFNRFVALFKKGSRRFGVLAARVLPPTIAEDST
jgi:hypothetical protein